MPGYHRIDLPTGRDHGFREAVLAGLGGDQPSLPCRYLYDEVGGLLFEAICATEAYYPTRCERQILSAKVEILAARFGQHAILELGSGSSEKTEIALAAWPAPARYLAVDLDGQALDRAGERLAGSIPGLEMVGVRGDYLSGLKRGREEVHGPALLLFLGGNIGNFSREEAAVFLERVRGLLEPGDSLLLGADLRKEGWILERAYDDPAGVTAAFNRNLLERVRRELGADLEPRLFRHEALYDEVAGVVRSYLTSQADQVIRIGKATFSFSSGARIHTEDAVKYDRRELEQLSEGGGFALSGHWLDPDGLYSLNLLEVR